jgi:hypothetical protein
MTLDSLQFALAAMRIFMQRTITKHYIRADETVNHTRYVRTIRITQALAYFRVEQVGKLRQDMCFRPREMARDA